MGELLHSAFIFITDFFKDSTPSKEIIIKRPKLKKRSFYRSMRIACAKQRFFRLFKKNNFFFLDLFLYFIKSFKYSLFNIFTNKKRIDYRLERTNHGFYFDFLENSTNEVFYIKNIIFVGWRYLWKALRFWFVSIFVFLFVFYYLSVIRIIPFNKIMFQWISLFMFFYWLLSGFVFFIKKYQFGKYTSVVQRFWRRSYIIFWLLEAFVFLVFFYFTANASAEPVYMFDQIQIFKTRLFSWRFFILKLLPLTFLIVIGYIYLLSVRWAVFSKNIIFLLTLTSVLTYVVWLEFYQFFHILNFYGSVFWVYDLDEHTWLLETEPRRCRILNHFTSILMILKFWHIVFIYGFWIFFLLRSYELKRVRYPLLSANLQNFIILYLFAWVSMYPWFKFYFRKLMDLPYYWFYINNHNYGFRVFGNDLRLIYYSITNDYLFNYSNIKFFNFKFFNFYYWTVYTADTSFNGYKNHHIKNEIIRSLSFI